MHFCFCCPISLDSSLAQWSRLFLKFNPNSFRQEGLIICLGTRATTANFGRQDCHNSGHITSVPQLPPPCSILQNPGKTEVLSVLPLMAALGTSENLSAIYLLQSISVVITYVPTLEVLEGYWFKTLCMGLCKIKKSTCGNFRNWLALLCLAKPTGEDSPYVCLETGRVVCGREGRQTRPFPTDTYFDKPKVANWF